MGVSVGFSSTHLPILPVFLLYFAALFCLDIIKLCFSDANISILCLDSEREGLLSFKTTLTDPSGRLSSWTGEECCKWNGIECSNRTGRVTNLNLRNPYQLINGGVGDPTVYKRSCLGGKINPALLQLEHLKCLDLSMNDFEGTQIPEFFDSYSSTRPPESRAENLNWISGLTSLKYLNLGFVKLDSAGTDWLQALNKLSALVELRLHWCKLQVPLSLPFINFTSLSVLDLSENSFNSEIPEWLFNLTSLSKLYLRWNFFNGPIPGEFANLKLLEVLDLSNNLDLGGEIPSFFGNLSRLKSLDLSANNLNGEIQEFLGGFSNRPNNLVFLDQVLIHWKENCPNH
ncbi:receptor-like protein EIX1 [Pistacia vera]|uniref:receptor-like protein EIX1 n=1 Tax=Pistacia vera TaxID=55513 RepID=UPI001263A83A|nr:receptor-like protein EIX1 [Pistacia vera]